MSSQATEKQTILAEIKSRVLEFDPSAEIILYGSQARGDAREDSDWDVLVLTEGPADFEQERKLRHRLYDITIETGAPISVKLRNREEWESTNWMTPVYQYIAEEGVAL